MATAPCPLPVINDEGKFLGIISRTTMLRFLDRETPPIPPAQSASAPLKLNPLFSSTDSQSPTLSVKPNVNNPQGVAHE